MTPPRHQPRSLQLYGLRLVLPFEPPSDLIRPADGHSVREVTFRAGSVEPIADPSWESGDATRVAIARRASSTTIAFADDRFRIDRTGVVYQSGAVETAVDLNYNALLAMILPYADMVSFHAYVVDTPWGRLAVVGESGAGKTTLGRLLTGAGGRLVADDLLALDRAGRARGGPPFLRVVDDGPGLAPDVGGKFRIPVPAEPVPVEPVAAYVVLDPGYDRPTPVGGLDAIDAILARPYAPAAARTDELALRLAAVHRSLSGASVLGLPPRWRSPEVMADRVLSFVRQRRAPVRPTPTRRGSVPAGTAGRSPAKRSTSTAS